MKSTSQNQRRPVDWLEFLAGVGFFLTPLLLALSGVLLAAAGLLEVLK